MTVGVCHCQRCDHDWIPREAKRLPLRCPRCKRYDWQKDSKDLKRKVISKVAVPFWEKKKLKKVKSTV